MIISKRRGRPKSENTKKYVCRVRLDESDMVKLDYIRDKFGESHTEALREGLRMRYNLALFKD